MSMCMEISTGAGVDDLYGRSGCCYRILCAVFYLQTLDDSKKSLIFLIFCNGLNIVLDIIFVLPFGMGVNGAATATIPAQIIAAVCCVVYTYKKIQVMRLALKNARQDRNLLVKMTKPGIPTGYQYSLMYLSSIILQRVVNGFGESVSGAFTATTQMEVLAEHVYTSMELQWLHILNRT